MRTLSWSEVETFIGCQAKHAYRYTYGYRPWLTGRSRALGQLVHELVDRVWFGADGQGLIDHAVEWVATNDKIRAQDPRKAWEPEAAEEIATQAIWLADRYMRFYDREGIEVLETAKRYEVPLQVGTQTLTFVAVIDRMLRWVDNRGPGPHGLWLHEVKTMSDWGREDLLDRDPQLTCYLWVLDRLGLEVHDAVFDAIKTYRWKTERPLADSFRRVLTDRTQNELAAFERELVAAAAQILAAESTGVRTRNRSRDCSWCDFLPPCSEHVMGFDPTQMLGENYRLRTGSK